MVQQSSEDELELEDEELSLHVQDVELDVDEQVDELEEVQLSLHLLQQHPEELDDDDDSEHFLSQIRGLLVADET